MVYTDIVLFNHYSAAVSKLPGYYSFKSFLTRIDSSERLNGLVI